jgi:WD40 repeat protein
LTILAAANGDKEGDLPLPPGWTAVAWSRDGKRLLAQARKLDPGNPIDPVGNNAPKQKKRYLAWSVDTRKPCDLLPDDQAAFEEAGKMKGQKDVKGERIGSFLRQLSPDKQWSARSAGDCFQVWNEAQRNKWEIPYGRRAGDGIKNLEYWDGRGKKEFIDLHHDFSRNILRLVADPPRWWLTLPSPDRKLVAELTSKGCSVRGEDPGNIRTFAKGMGAWDVTWSPDGRWLAAISFQRTVLWDARTSQEFSDGNDPITPVFNDFQFQWSPDSRCLAVVSGQNQKKDNGDEPDRGTAFIKLYVNGPIWEVRRIQAHSWEGDIVGVLWSPDSRRLASVEQGLVRVFDGNSGAELQQFKARLLKRTNVTYDGAGLLPIAWSPKGDRLAIADVNGKIIVSDTETWKVFD